MLNKKSLLATAALALAAGTASAQIQITEWMYNGNGPTGEYVEFTNLGSTAVSFAGWSFDDDSRTPGVVDLSGLGLVQPGQSVILTEATATDFRAAWGLAASVAVIGSNGANLGRVDEMNLFNASGSLVDRLAYGDTTIAGTIRAQNNSGNPLSLADLSTQTVNANWVLASVGDGFGSRLAPGGVDVGNPGFFALAQPVPEPSTYALLLAGLAAVGFVARRKS